MMITIILTNVLWFLITAYLVWHITGRPVIISPRKKGEELPLVEEATDEEILGVMKRKQVYDSHQTKADKYEDSGIPTVENNEVE